MMPGAHAKPCSRRRRELLETANAAAVTFQELALRLHAHPEVGLEEHRAATWICEVMESAGFSVERGVADLTTAFVATWGDGETGRPDAISPPAAPSPHPPVIAFLAEYDALPALGHACGHNLIA